MILKEISKKADYETIVRYGKLTDDHNPIHTDHEFAATTEMGSIIAHGTMSLGLIWEAIEQTFGAQATAASVVDVRFTRPVKEDDVITSGGKQVDASTSEFQIWAKNQHGEIVVSGTVRIGS